MTGGNILTDPPAKFTIAKIDTVFKIISVAQKEDKTIVNC